MLTVRASFIQFITHWLIFYRLFSYVYSFQFGGRQKSGKGGKSGLIMSRDRGRYLRPVIPKEGESVRVAIDATLREAAKNQVGNLE
jgi:magnesium chelatase subunit D